MITYNTYDKSEWGEGAWQSEPDKASWDDPETGYSCLIVRTSHAGALCGYVGLNPSHPLYEKDYDNCDVEVHGGLTFADSCQHSDDPAYGICHIPKPGEPDNVWWLGFDTAHAYDFWPAMYSTMKKININSTSAYRDFDYVKSEVESLARQLKALECPYSSTGRAASL